MNEKTNAPDGFYDGKLVGAETREVNGSLVLELQYDVGNDYFWAKETVWLYSAPSGDATKDANRAEWLKDSIARLREVFPEAVRDGKFDLKKLGSGDPDITEKTIRVKVSADGNYTRGKAYPNRQRKPKMDRADALKMAEKHARELAKFGISLGESAVAPAPVAVAETSDDTGLPF